MKRRGFFRSAFGLAVLGCLALAGWALLSGGLFDGPIAKELRATSVYVAPGVDVDEAAAERVIGNRRFTVAFLPPGADLGGACDEISGAADGTLGMMLSPDGTNYRGYGCLRFPEVDFGEENFGKAVAAEQLIGKGVDGLAARPLNALKVAVVNYDLLVESGVLPPDARTVSPSLPRYLLAASAVAAVLLGAAGLYLTGRRAARAAERRRQRRDAEADASAELSAAAATLAQRIIDLDRRYTRGISRAATQRTGPAAGYQRLATDYANLLPLLETKDHDVGALQAKVDALLRRAVELTPKR